MELLIIVFVVFTAKTSALDDTRPEIEIYAVNIIKIILKNKVINHFISSHIFVKIFIPLIIPAAYITA